MIRITCPSCESRFTVDDRFAGKRGKCARCGASLQVPEVSDESAGPGGVGSGASRQRGEPGQGERGAATESSDPLNELAAAASGAADADPDPGPAEQGIDDAVQALDAQGSAAPAPAEARRSTGRRSGGPEPDAAAESQPPPRAWTLGVTSLALAVVALLICWIPWVGIVSLSLSLLGLVMGVIALIMALARRNTGLGFPMAGSVLSFLTLLLVTQMVLSAIEGPLNTVSSLMGGGGMSGGSGGGSLLGELDSLTSRQGGGGRSSPELSREPIERSADPSGSSSSADSQEGGDQGASAKSASADGSTPGGDGASAPAEPAAGNDGQKMAGDGANGGGASSPRSLSETAAERQPAGQDAPDQEKEGAGEEPGDSGSGSGDGSESEQRWVPASEAASYGPLEIRIVSVKVDRFAVPDLLGDRRRMELLGIKVRLVNRSESRKIDHMSWAGPGIDLNEAVNSQDPLESLSKLARGAQSGMRPGLADNFGNQYKQHMGGSTDYLIGGGGPESESIRPGESAEDTILFEQPVPKAESLRLQLPARYFGGKGVIRFRIPAEMVEGLG